MYFSAGTWLILAGLSLAGAGAYILRRTGKAARQERLMGPTIIDLRGLLYYLGLLAAVFGGGLVFSGIMLTLP